MAEKRRKKNAGGLSPGHSLVWVTFPDEQKALIRDAAKGAHLPMSEFGRRVLLAAAMELAPTANPHGAFRKWLNKVLHPA